MKINRFIVLTALALLVVVAMGTISLKVFAQTANPPAAQTQDIEDPATGPDIDNVEEQVGEQVEDSLPDAAEAPGAEDAGLNEQTPSYTGSIAVDQAATEGMSEADESDDVQGKATISAADAEVLL